LTQERAGPDSEPAAFSGLSGARLAAIVGVSQERFLSLINAVNLLGRYPGRTARAGSDDFDLVAARLEAARIAPKLLGSTILLAGRSVAEAFDASNLGPLESVERGSSVFVLLPHPSSRNRWWNSLENVERARELLVEVVLKWKRPPGIGGSL
jgi:hypothetical protein